jgi:hypothetical protein
MHVLHVLSSLFSWFEHTSNRRGVQIKTSLILYLYSSSVSSPSLIFFFWLPLQPLWALVSFQFPDIFTIGRTPWTSDLPKHRTAQTQNKHIYTPNIHALSGIRTHDHGLRASEDSSCLRTLGYSERPSLNYQYFSLHPAPKRTLNVCFTLMQKIKFHIHMKQQVSYRPRR